MTKQEYLNYIDDIISAGSYSANWQSLSNYETPEWFHKAKFGIFIHWGLYSIPAFNNEWYSRNMYEKGSPEYEYHISTYGEHKYFGYKDFIPMFTSKKFDPDYLADLFSNAGAKYVFPVAEHHDGFQMYESVFSDYNAYKMGPKRDIIKELKTSFERKNLIFCTSSHRAEHWWFMGGGKHFDSDIKEPLQCGDFYWPSVAEHPHEEDLYSKPYPSKEYLDDWLVRTCEIVDKYQPKLIYFDWWIQHEAFKPYLTKFAAYYYNQSLKNGYKAGICYKHDAMMFGTGIVDVERGKFADCKPYYWQTDTAIAKNSWCYTTSLDYKTSQEIICYLVDVVSKNGNLLLNVGPKADGSIPEKDEQILADIGNWLKINGEAIYNSNVWRFSSEGPTKEIEGKFSEGNLNEYTCKDIRFTIANGYLYATVLKCPSDGNTTITLLADSKDQNTSNFHGIIKDITLLGFDTQTTWSKDENGLHIHSENVNSSFPIVYKISLF